MYSVYKHFFVIMLVIACSAAVAFPAATQQQSDEAVELLNKYPVLAKKYPQLQKIAGDRASGKMPSKMSAVAEGAKVASCVTVATAGYTMAYTVALNRLFPGYFTHGKIWVYKRENPSTSVEFALLGKRENPPTPAEFALLGFFIKSGLRASLARKALNSDSATQHAMVWTLLNLPFTTLIGSILPLAAQVGFWPKVGVRDVGRQGLVFAGFTAVGSVLSGVKADQDFKAKGLDGVARGDSFVDKYMRELKGADEARRYYVNLQVHKFAGSFGQLGLAVGLPCYTLYRRRQLAQQYEKRAQTLIQQVGV